MRPWTNSKFRRSTSAMPTSREISPCTPAADCRCACQGQGRVPLDGASGDNDWKGWIPRNELPLEINPARHFVASANNRPTPVGYPHYVGWMWDASYRIRRIHELLHPAKDLTINKMAPIQNDAYDKGAERFVPVLLSACRKSLPQDAFAQRAGSVIGLELRRRR